MKCFLLSISVFLIAPVLKAQRLYLNIGAGIMNYGGDLQDKEFTLNQAQTAYSLGLGYKLSEHFLVNFNYVNGIVTANDQKSNAGNARRNLNFTTNINEGSLTMEAQWREISEAGDFTPYIFAGLAVYHFNPYTFDTAGVKTYLQPLGTEGQGLPQYPDRKMYKLTQLAIPFGIGIRYAIGDRVTIGAEIDFRKLFTDHLDDASSRSYADTAILRAARGSLAAKLSFRGDELKPPLTFSERIRRGNPDRNDDYYTCLIKLSFALGNASLGSGNGYSKKMRKQNGCPTKVF